MRPWLPLLTFPLVLACAGAPTDSKGDEVDGGSVDEDGDGDGFSGADDCNDADAATNPSASELCNNIDDNCDGNTDEGVSSTWYTDNDDDGFGDETAPVLACAQPEGAVPTASDCDDTEEAIFPGATELCNDLDDNCDGQVDEGLTEIWYPDGDGDGFGDDSLPAELCELPSDDFVQIGGDCNDEAPEAFPGAAEVCDEIDNDCDELVDEEVEDTFYEDRDEDGWGDSANTASACTVPTGYALNPGDCEDEDELINPGETEVCNGYDDDCDGDTDETGSLGSTTWYYDGDGDGYGIPGTTTTSCEAPPDYVALSSAFDCDDSDSSAYPTATELCGGGDEDCDGSVDEDEAADAPTWYADADSDGYGGTAYRQAACTQPSGYVSTNTDCDDLSGTVNPGAAEICNSVDDDCDTSVDEGVTTSTWYADADSDGWGDAGTTSTGCAALTGYVSVYGDCDDLDDDVSPDADERCDTIDNDCDGQVDDLDADVIDQDIWYRDADGDGYGIASTTIDACFQPSGYVSTATDCNDGSSSAYPGGTETCNSIDDDCDSVVDNGVLGTGSACPALDCTEILDDNPGRASGTYSLDAGSFYCDMSTDGGGWTRVGYGVAVWGTGYDTTWYNSEAFTWTETLVHYNSGSVTAHCTYPGSLTGCNNLGVQFTGEYWGTPLYWGSSICGMATTDYSSATTYVGGYDFVISRGSSTSSLRVGTLEGISSCTTGDNPGTAYVDLLLRR